ncbi:uncharacterized protein F5147DRAFT_652952 [Suillus discolor]|uniref:Uncharacterized protein n=1 Tax=Suillus discolor TaxID=1912936 RepID=A0A9P7JTN5_9AGAM|nr:uncharacterized protein F5147DRAFT_652952 [Suillus discolor]KAG2108229.1 hypothetical protein F5147DRAFT_652952 [Suillus discolor]
MVLTGGTFNSKNVWKVQDKFNVTWQDFVQRIEVTDIMKFNGKEKEYHKLLCCKEENLCGLDDYPGIEHRKETFNMIERFVKEKEASWTAKKESCSTSANPQLPTNNRKGKQVICDAPQGPAESMKGKNVVLSSRKVKKLLEQEHENTQMSENQKAVRQTSLLQETSTIVQNDAHSMGLASEKGNGNGKGSTHLALEKLDVLTISPRYEPLSDAPEALDGVKSKQTEMSQEHSYDLMQRGFTEGDGVAVSTSPLAWMIGRYCVLVGIPIDNPLNGQLILQSPDEYDNLPEHDYLEALGIECLYAALVNTEESPGHLIHLAHALGRAAKETNILSDSKPNAASLDPLPPTLMPHPRTLQKSTGSAYKPVGSITSVSGSDGSTESRDLEQDDQCMSYHASRPNEVLYILDDDVGHVSDNRCHASKCFASPEFIDIDLISHEMMDMESVKSEHNDHINDDLKEVKDGEVKRKREDEISLSPPIIRLFFLLKASINRNHMSQKAQDGGGDKKRSKLLDSISCLLETPNDLDLMGSAIFSDITSTPGVPGVWCMTHHLLLSEGPLSEADVDAVMEGPGEDTTANKYVGEHTDTPGQGEAPTTNKTGMEQVSAATQLFLP